MSGTAPAILLQLASDPGRPSLASVQDELAKLELIRRLELPADLFDHALPQELERYRQRVAIEAPYELLVTISYPLIHPPNFAPSLEQRPSRDGLEDSLEGR